MARTNRVAWGLAAVLAAVVLGGGGLTVVRLRPYWVARYHGVEARLHGVCLARASLVGADLRGADLSYADLHGADLRQANLRWANLRGARLRGAKLEGATIVQCSLLAADLRGAGLQRVKAWSVGWGWGVILERADLTDANFSGAELQGAGFEGARLIGTDFSRANLRGASFQWADLRGAKLLGADLRDAYLGETRMEGANVSGAVYSRPTRSDTGTHWPSGFDPLMHGAILIHHPAR